MAFAPGDSVHVRAIGKGLVREVRNNGRLLVEVNGRAIVTTADQVEHFDAPRRHAKPAKKATHVYEPRSEVSVSLDLHGMTVEEASDAVIAFIDRALRGGSSEARIIHGRSGGRLKAALHAQLKSLPSIRGFSLDPRNAGVTVVRL